MSDESLRELFRELREEPMAADSLGRVRAGVRRGITVRRRRFFALLALAPAAAAFLAVIAVTARQPLVAPRLATPAPVTAPAILEQPPEQEPARPRVRAVAQRKKKEPEKPVLIRIETADPEVVILLVGN